MICILKAFFDEGKNKFIEKEGKYYIELKFEGKRISKTSQIELLKLIVKVPITQLSDRIKIIENNYKNMLK